MFHPTSAFVLNLFEDFFCVLVLLAHSVEITEIYSHEL